MSGRNGETSCFYDEAVNDLAIITITPSVNSRLCVLGDHISGGGGKFDAFFVFWVFFSGNLGFWGVNPPEDSWN